MSKPGPFDVSQGEAVLLIKRGDAWFAAHIPDVDSVTMDTIVHETEELRDGAICAPGYTVIDGYKVEMHGVADRITLWSGAIPGLEGTKGIEGTTLEGEIEG